jgi:MFS family permease
MSLMTTRRFAPLFWCQFFSAFGDNFLKTALVFLILFQVAGADSEALITLAGATLIVPFFFLSGLGGELADRYDKAMVAQRLKLAEIGVAALAVAGSVRSNTASCPTISRARNCRPATPWLKAGPSLPSCSAPSSPGSRRGTAATRSTLRG